MTERSTPLPNMIAFIALSVAGVEVARTTKDVFVMAVVLVALAVLGAAMIRQFRERLSSGSRGDRTRRSFGGRTRRPPNEAAIGRQQLVEREPGETHEGFHREPDFRCRRSLLHLPGVFGLPRPGDEYEQDPPHCLVRIPAPPRPLVQDLSRNLSYRPRSSITGNRTAQMIGIPPTSNRNAPMNKPTSNADPHPAPA
ncbi:hypothetical protein [Nocardia rhamnosiphila]|uniref:hypothetical protein n=1 Tax=Nocardia rhamnosiphila TaxID=426716 RepID=UPI0012DD6764|nr:hypothetical protein [Nocardia rhamnosiphila]